MFTGVINHAGCWENTRKACKSPTSFPLPLVGRRKTLGTRLVNHEPKAVSKAVSKEVENIFQNVTKTYFSYETLRSCCWLSSQSLAGIFSPCMIVQSSPHLPILTPTLPFVAKRTGDREGLFICIHGNKLQTTSAILVKVVESSTSKEDFNLTGRDRMCCP